MPGRAIDKRVSQYYAAFLILEGLMIGVFSALDALLFYVFFEGMLIPMFIIIGVWGGPRRVYASVKFFLYTFLGSVFMLVGLIYLYLKGGSWQLADMAALPLTMSEQTWLFFAFLVAFAVKVPMFPVHTWLPDAHVEAPTGGSVILAAIMLKIGGYGFLRFVLPIVPDAGHDFAWLVIALSLIAVVYVGLVALVQEDMKKLIAYSSVSHMGFVTLGTFIAFALVRDDGLQDAARLGLQGAMVQMICHGFISGAMFSCVGVLYDRMHSRMISDYGGVANVMPWFAMFWVFFAMANSGLPGTSGFVGEFMVILAAFQHIPLIAFTRGLHPDHRRRLHAVADQAGDLGRGRQRPRRRARGHQHARMDRAGRVRHRRAGAGRVSQAADRPDGAVHRATGEPARRDQALRCYRPCSPSSRCRPPPNCCRCSRSWCWSAPRSRC